MIDEYNEEFSKNALTDALFDYNDLIIMISKYNAALAAYVCPPST